MIPYGGIFIHGEVCIREQTQGVCVVLGAPLEAAVKDYQRHCPWFSDLPEASLRQAVLWGEAARCRDRLAEMRAQLGVDMPVLDLTGLDETATLRALEVFAPAKPALFP